MSKRDLYCVFIRWGGNPVFRIPTEVTANTYKEAAYNRIGMLITPEKYDDVLVVHSSCHGVAEIYSISQWAEDTKTDIKTAHGVPKPKYGWRG